MVVTEFWKRSQIISIESDVMKQRYQAPRKHNPKVVDFQRYHTKTKRTKDTMPKPKPKGVNHKPVKPEPKETVEDLIKQLKENNIGLRKFVSKVVVIKTDQLLEKFFTKLSDYLSKK